MNNLNSVQPLSSQSATTLYILLGRAVWAIQHLEDALNHGIAIKNPEAKNKTEGDRILSSYRELPLGRAIERADKERTYRADLQKRLKDFLNERNWLIHRCMHESVDEMGIPLDEGKLFQRIRNVELAALSLKEAIEIDMLEFTSSKGRSDVRETVRQYYIDWLNTQK